MHEGIPGFEYGFLAKTVIVEPDGAGALPGGIDELLCARLASFSEPLTCTLQTFDGGGWEAVSHDVAVVGAQLIVTVMIRRLHRGRATNGEALKRAQQKI